MSINFSSDQVGVTFLCSVDTAVESTCASPIVYSGIDNGQHLFQVRARSIQGLMSNAVNYTWNVDTIAPMVSISALISPTNQASASIGFTSTESSTFNCSLDGGAGTACSSPYPVIGLIEGAHSFIVTGTDGAGNLGLPARIDWVVDVTAPMVQIVDMNPAVSPSSSTSRSISFASNESATFECSVDGASFAACVSPYSVDNLIDGSHLFLVRPTDTAGNLGVSASASWVTDLTPPQIAFGTVLPAQGQSNSSTFHAEFSSNEPGTFQCSFDGATPMGCSSPIDGAFSTDGSHTFDVVAIDLAGLQSVPVGLSWIIDRTAPDLSFGAILPSASAVIASDVLDVEVKSPESVTLQASLNGIDIGPVVSPIHLAGLAEGSNQLVVSGVDVYGNHSAAITHAFSVDITPPTLTMTATYSNSALTNNNANSFTFAASESSSFQCELDGAGFSACVTPVSIAGLIDGIHQLEVVATDVAGNASQVSVVNWNVDTTAPLTTLTSSQTGTSTYKFGFSSNEPSSTFVCSIDGGVESSCVTPISFNFSTGGHVFTVRAIDAAGNKDMNGASASFTVRVPIATYISSNGITYTSQTSMSFSFSSNYVEATFVCSLDGAAAIPCVAPVSLNGLSDSMHSFRVQAVDSFGIADQTGATWTWTVDTQSPVIISTSSATTSSTVTITWTLNELATGKMNWGAGADTSRITAETGLGTSQSIRLSGLSPNTLYSFQISGSDRAGNVYIGSKFQVRTRF
jgi:hypothetical protein